MIVLRKQDGADAEGCPLHKTAVILAAHFHALVGVDSREYTFTTKSVDFRSDGS